MPLRASSHPGSPNSPSCSALAWYSCWPGLSPWGESWNRTRVARTAALTRYRYTTQPTNTLHQRYCICIDIQYCLVYCCPVLINTTLILVTISEFILQFIFIQKTAILIHVASEKRNNSMNHLIDHDFINSLIDCLIMYLAIISFNSSLYIFS